MSDVEVYGVTITEENQTDWQALGTTGIEQHWIAFCANEETPANEDWDWKSGEGISHYEGAAAYWATEYDQPKERQELYMKTRAYWDYCHKVNDPEFGTNWRILHEFGMPDLEEME